MLPPRVLSVPTDGLFAVGASALNRAGRTYVGRIAPQLAGVKRVVCVGHTDAVGSAAANRALGLARARAVCAALARAGFSGGLRTATAGERSPRADNRTARGRALNRRVQLRIEYR